MFVTTTVKRLVLSAITLPLVFAGVSSAHAETAKSNPYPAGTPQSWAWQNRPDLPGNLGAPYAWSSNAKQQGFPVSEYPRRGDVAVFEPGVLGADPQAGEVAFVEQVLQDGQFTVSIMQGSVARHTYTLQSGTSFIHYQKDTRTTWGFASGQSGWTSQNLGVGNMGGPGWFYPLAGDNPQLISPDLDVTLDGTYNTIEVDMAQGIPVGDATVQVYFATDTQPNFTEANSIKVKGIADGELHRYSFSFGSNPAWQGHLTKLRLDPAGGGTTGGVRVDRVRLVQAEGQTTDPVRTYGTTDGDHGGRRR